MPTWVVPSIAADIWGVPVSQVLSRMQEGHIASRTEGGFTFVDMDPYGLRPIPKASPRQTRPTTFRGLSEEELTALHPDSPPIKPVAVIKAPAGPIESPPDWEAIHWRDARRVVQRRRKAPTAESAANQ